MKLMLACLLIIALVAGTACTQPSEAPPETSLPLATPETQAPTTTPPPATTTPAEEETETPPPAAITEEDVEAARQVVFAYWEAFNNYDLEGVLACTEESWGQEREPSLSSEIGQMKMFSVTLGVEEEGEPAINTNETIEIKIRLTTPIDTRLMTFHLTEIENEWKIYLVVEE